MKNSHLSQLQGALYAIEPLLQRAIYYADQNGNNPHDALRGLIITREEIAQHLQNAGLVGLWADADGVEGEIDLHSALADLAPSSRLAQLIDTFALEIFDVYILLICLAAELDRRYERIFAYLQDDVSLRRPTVNLAMNLLGSTTDQRFGVWQRLADDAPLRKYRLIEITADASRPNSAFMSHLLKINSHLVDHLLGIDKIDSNIQLVANYINDTRPAAPIAIWDTLENVFTDAPLIYFKGRPEMGQREVAASISAKNNLSLLCIDLEKVPKLEITPQTAYSLIMRDGRLLSSALFFEHWETILDENQEPPPELWQALTDYPYPVFLSGRNEWESSDTQRNRALLRYEFDIPKFETRLSLWQSALKETQTDLSQETIRELASKFLFSPKQIKLVVRSAIDIALSRGTTPDKQDFHNGAQAHANLKLGKLASRIMPRMDWDDLILPPDQVEQLQELCQRVHLTPMVNETWGFGRRNTRGISALFAGESGTGKTLASEVVAKQLGLIMYKVDLSSVVSKYIGETEKNLSAIFDEAQTGNAILFFDEADALFGKRSEVRDAHDRYANIEVAYLLQRIESFDGVVILATNFRHNLDDAFSRRLDYIIDFPFPDAEYREKIWSAHFPPRAPLSEDVDLAQIAERYRLAGGNIRNAALTAAYLAAGNGQSITMAHIRAAIRREQQKLGRLLED